MEWVPLSIRFKAHLEQRFIIEMIGRVGICIVLTMSSVCVYVCLRNKNAFYSMCLKDKLQDCLNQCPMLINADQNCGIDPNVDQFRSIDRN